MYGLVGLLLVTKTFACLTGAYACPTQPDIIRYIVVLPVHSSYPSGVATRVRRCQY